jgi:nitrogenase molybdenum-iron protein alpha/beta subunit
VRTLTLHPDSLTGTLLSLEGIADAQVILNGPTGCKLYHAFLSERQYLRQSRAPPAREFSCGQARIPCTGLDGKDYMNGAVLKNEEVLASVADTHSGLLVIVNAPGAALIGDDLDRCISTSGLFHRCLAIETPPVSRPASEGFTDAALKVLRYLSPQPRDRKPKKVNLAGISLLQKHWEGDVAELKRLLSLMGIEVGATLVAGSSAEELRQSSDASCNLVICGEYGLALAQWYRSEYGIPFILSPAGAPVGFDATERWIREIADITGADPAPVLRELGKARERAYRLFRHTHLNYGFPKGATFAIAADSSVALPLTTWLYSYAGMVPLGVTTLPGGQSAHEEALKEFLVSHGFEESWQSFPGPDRVDIVYSDGHTGGLLMGTGRCRSVVEISLPSEDTMMFVPRPIMGISGAMNLLEESMRRLRALS